MLILRQAHYISVSFLAAAAATTIPIGIVSLAPQGIGYAVTKISAKALKDSKLPVEIVPAIKAGLLTFSFLSIIAGFILFGPLLGGIFAISLTASFFLNQGIGQSRRIQ